MYEALENQLNKWTVPYQRKALLKDYITFQVGGPCPLLICPRNSKDLEKSVLFLHQHDLDFFVLGRGSNVLVADNGIDVPVIYTQSEKPDIQIHGDQIVMSSGTKIDQAAAFAAEHGLSGINFMSGIPGTIGGAVIGNAGAFGAQIGACITQIETVSRSGEKVTLRPKDLSFSYRDSIFKHEPYTILSANIKVVSADKDKLLRERNEFLKLRSDKHVDYHQVPCAGSFFKNIISDSGERQAIGMFLEQAGCKSLTHGGAAVFDGHANIIINTGAATANDIYALAQMMRRHVKEKFNLDLMPEVQLIGDFTS